MFSRLSHFLSPIQVSHLRCFSVLNGKCVESFPTLQMLSLREISLRMHSTTRMKDITEIRSAVFSKSLSILVVFGESGNLIKLFALSMMFRLFCSVMDRSKVSTT